MRALIISWEYPPHIEGGLGRHVAELAPALAAQDVNVDVVTPASQLTVQELRNQIDPDQTPPVPVVSKQSVVTVEEGVIVHRLAAAPQTAPDIFQRAAHLNQLLKEYVTRLLDQQVEWSLIHTHDWLTGPAGLALKEKHGLPLVATIHATERGRGRGHLSNDLQRAIDQAERELIEGADRVIVCSQHMFSELQTFFETPAAKMEVVPNGVDFDSLFNGDSDESLAAFRAEYAGPEEKIVFTISRLVYEKGVHRLVEAIPAILEQCPKTQFVIAGKGPEAEHLQHKAQKLGVAEQTHFIGFISDEDRNRLFRVANCAIFPSLYEPFGIVALEAMALGCPVVASDVGGLSEVVTHQETGITVYPDDPGSIAWGVVRALTRPDWSRRHTENAQRWVEEFFNWPRIATLTKQVYRRALTPSKTA